jgi:4-amino-4-deoxy-L-arabinose transferase-like glycosyltransferase
MVAGARTYSLEETFLAPHILDPPPTRHALLAFLLALAAVLHIGTAAWGDLYDGVEGQVAGAAREMVGSGQWLVPANNGVPLVKATPLAYWAVAASYKIFGLNATAARLPIALAMIGSVALTFLIGERLAGYWRGFAAGLIYLCSAGAFLLGRLVAPENIFCFFVTAAIYCALCGYQRQKFRRIWFAGFWLSAALATLTTGLEALLVLGAILLPLSFLFREARLRFKALLHWTNLLLFVAIVAPWMIWASNHVPGFAAPFFSFADGEPALTRGRFLLLHLAWWFPALFLVLPGLIFAPRKIFRPNELTFSELLPVCWVTVVILAALLVGERRAASSAATLPGFALFAACAWERTSRPLRAAGVALGVVIGLTVMAAAYFRPAIIESVLDRSLSGAVWNSLRPLTQIAVGALLVSAIAALLFIQQRGEVMLVLALAGMLPVGFCLIESGSRATPFLSLANAAQYLNPRLGRTGEVVYEGSLSSGSSLSFYLEKKFFLLNQRPGLPNQSGKYIDEHFLLEAWDRSDPIYLIIDEERVSYWRRLITQRVHIYHQVTTCGRRVVLSNQL